MRYFKYQYSGSMGNIWALFSGIKDAPNEVIEAVKNSPNANYCNYEHTLEIINSAMNGNIPNYDDSFDLKSYEYACQKQDRMEKNSSKNKTYFIVDDDEEEEENKRLGYKEVSSRTLGTSEDAYEMFEENEVFEKSLKDLIDIRSFYTLEFGIDPMELLKSALLGIPEAVKELREISDGRLKEIITNLCEYGSDGYLLSRLESCLE